VLLTISQSFTLRQPACRANATNFKDAAPLRIWEWELK
jgi:hypothetical protein